MLRTCLLAMCMRSWGPGSKLADRRDPWLNPPTFHSGQEPPTFSWGTNLYPTKLTKSEPDRMKEQPEYTHAVHLSTWIHNQPAQVHLPISKVLVSCDFAHLPNIRLLHNPRINQAPDELLIAPRVQCILHVSRVPSNLIHSRSA